MGRAWAVVVAVGLSAACGGTGDQAGADRPAVVQVPAPLVPGDTMKIDTMPGHHDKMQATAREFTREYTLLAAAMGYGDRRMMSTIYDQNATLTIGDSVRHGNDAIASVWADFARAGSIRAFGRLSRRVEAVGELYVDSGTYTIQSQRTEGPMKEDHGRYVTHWKRDMVGKNPWIIMSDELMPDPKHDSTSKTVKPKSLPPKNRG
jgi:ketosteroid isomerase-like protein